MAERGYIRARPPSARPGVLDVQDGATRYQFELLTAHLNEEHEGCRRVQSPHEHDVYHIVLFTRGENCFLLDGTVTSSRPGRIALAAPGQGHSFYPGRPGVAGYHEVTFALESPAGPLRASFAKLLSFYTGLEIRQTPPTLDLPRSRLPAMETLYERLIDTLEQPEPVDWLGIYRTVLEILAFVAARVTPIRNVEERIDALSESREFIERNYTRRLTLPELADRAHMSEAHFCRAFKARFGLAPIAYQQELRVAAARNLLISTDLRCKEIADRLGYADVYCFSKAFKKHAGRSPSELRG
ncbi:MAG: helix-turn-helix transcriptional regulator [Phycisphaerae bacterium]|nr:helix-turn-helix transcriptional regulator [Phycisphaerae bacterium]